MTTMQEPVAPAAAIARAPGNEVTIASGDRLVRLTNLDRVMWPGPGVVKRTMLAYYAAVAPLILPYLADRPVSLRRFPEGIGAPGWYQAQCRGRPDWMRTHDVLGHRGEMLRYCAIDDAAGLLWAANLGTVEFHPLAARPDRPDEPTALVIDLDPGPPAGLLAACRVGLVVRTALERLGLTPVVKTSGSLGLHVEAGLTRGASFQAAKRVARALGSALARRRPELVVDHVSRAARRGLVFVDWVQNDPNRSTVAPWSLRAMPWPLVSMPLRWDEVEAAVRAERADGLLFGPREALERASSAPDPFADVLDGRADLPDAEAVADAVADALGALEALR